MRKTPYTQKTSYLANVLNIIKYEKTVFKIWNTIKKGIFFFDSWINAIRLLSWKFPNLKQQRSIHLLERNDFHSIKHISLIIQTTYDSRVVVEHAQSSIAHAFANRWIAVANSIRIDRQPYSGSFRLPTFRNSNTERDLKRSLLLLSTW